MLVNIAVNYKSAPLATLEAATLRDPGAFYQILKTVPGIRGTVILQTCNRVEFFLEVEEETEVVDKVLWHWALETRFKLGELTRLVERKLAESVIEHLVRLGSGLESMLVGESQILGQVRKALVEARAHGAITPLLVELFDRSTSSASNIREISGIGKGAVSLGSAAVRLAEETLGPLQDKIVLLIGTGHVGILTIKALRARDLNNVVVAGRTYERTESFCHSYGGTPIGITQLDGYLPFSDLVIVATTAKNYLLTREQIADAIQKTHRSRLMILDLSTPRNVSPEVGKVHGVTLKTLEDLKGIADATLAKRRQIVKEAEPLVKVKTEEISNLLRRKNAEPIVSEIYQRAEQIRAEVFEKALSHLSLDPDQKKMLENMSMSLVEKILEKPAIHLRKAAERGDTQVLTVAGNIFGADDR